MHAKLLTKIQEFHGHMCPGLAMGIRAAEIALEEIGAHSGDEEFAKVRAGIDTPEERSRFQELHLIKSKVILNTPREQLFTFSETRAKPPKKARIHSSIECQDCGESAMETRIRKFGERDLCIPSFEKIKPR